MCKVPGSLSVGAGQSLENDYSDVEVVNQSIVNESTKESVHE